ncbi:hypothetical protein KM043_003461 [Ampulex compressa]|nr:hypothetical protein KM043_003461 [Ampulex compressa]
MKKKQKYGRMLYRGRAATPLDAVSPRCRRRNPAAVEMSQRKKTNQQLLKRKIHQQQNNTRKKQRKNRSLQREGLARSRHDPAEGSHVYTETKVGGSCGGI